MTGRLRSSPAQGGRPPGKVSAAVEFIRYLILRRKYFLVPVAAILLVLAALVILAEYQAVAPFIYTLF